MKREILCTACAEKLIQLIGDGSQYPGEHVKYVKGKIKPDDIQEYFTFKCDHCIVDLPPGEDCVAVSIWADYSSSPYFDWESIYIDIDENHPGLDPTLN